MRLIGLTGGIATGKTSVAKLITSKYHAPILNVDDISRSVTALGSPILKQISDELGEGCLSEDGTLNRAFLRERLISDKDFAKELEGIVIPAILQNVNSTLQRYENDGHEIVFVENAVMIEKETYKNYDEILVVTCSEETQLKRVMSRDGQTEEQARGIIALQLPLSEKEAIATYLIRNESCVTALELEVDRVWKEILEVK